LIDEIEENQGCKLFREKHGIRAVRGMEVDTQLDERRRDLLDWEVKDPNNKY
jgi:hypothetical protein